jgi:hypothetical protein
MAAFRELYRPLPPYFTTIFTGSIQKAMEFKSSLKQSKGD